MKYYLHDTNAFNDEKITELFMKFGYEGLGLFYTILEKIAQQEKPVKTNVLKSQLKVGKRLNKCWKFMEEIDIISSNNGETFNKQLLNFSEKYLIKKEKNRKRIADWRDKQENVTRYEHVRNSPKDNISKDNISKVKREKDKSRRFTPPTLQEVTEYCLKRNNNIDPQHFLNTYEARGWKINNNKMKDWQACVRTWENRDKKSKPLYESITI